MFRNVARHVFVTKRVGEMGVVDTPVPFPGPNDAIVRSTAGLSCISDRHTVRGATGDRTKTSVLVPRGRRRGSAGLRGPPLRRGPRRLRWAAANPCRTSVGSRRWVEAKRTPGSDSAVREAVGSVPLARARLDRHRTGPDRRPQRRGASFWLRLGSTGGGVAPTSPNRPPRSGAGSPRPLRALSR